MAQPEIPDFDGREVTGLRIAVSGTDEHAEQLLHTGDEVTLIVRGHVSGIAHKEDKFGHLRRVQSVAVDGTMPADQKSVAKIVRDMKRREEEASGQQPLDIDDGLDDDLDEKG